MFGKHPRAAARGPGVTGMAGRAVSKFWFWNAGVGVVEENLGKAQEGCSGPKC